jgi:hypothetical protein
MFILFQVISMSIDLSGKQISSSSVNANVALSGRKADDSKRKRLWFNLTRLKDYRRVFTSL